MARLNITIPDALFAQLAPYRAQLNISRICAQALAREIEGAVLQPTPVVQDLLTQIAHLTAEEQQALRLRAFPGPPARAHQNDSYAAAAES